MSPAFLHPAGGSYTLWGRNERRFKESLVGGEAQNEMWKPILFSMLVVATVGAQPLTDELTRQIDQAAKKALREGGPPSLVIGIVRGGQPVWARAYGQARPGRAAQAEMRYAIGSVSKQFTVTALLMLQEQGKLSLDDPVSRYFPELTRSGEVTLAQLLSHTSGYSDYYPQDYLPISMRAPTSAAEIMRGWAQRPLDFDPGTRWQYSNTNYVIAGAVVERVTGASLADLLRQRIFDPLAMPSASVQAPDPQGTFRYAGGPPRPMPLEAPGWLFATGDLVMNVHDLMKWDQALLEHRLLKPESYQRMEREVLTCDGKATGYALGLSVTREHERRCLGHGGEVSGFTCENLVFPDEHTAVVVLSNQMATPVPHTLAREVLKLLWKPADDALARHQSLLDSLRRAKIESSLLSPNARDFFSPQALADYRNLLAKLGPVRKFELVRRYERGGMVGRVYRLEFKDQRASLHTFTLPDGRFEQYLITPMGNR